MMTEQRKQELLNKLIEGSINKREYRHLEMAALDDPFLFDALEGYSHSENHQTHIDNIYKHLFTKNKKKSLVPYWKYAAAVAALVLPLIIWYSRDVKVDNTLASTNTKPNVQQNEQEIVDKSLAQIEDTNSVAHTTVTVPQSKNKITLKLNSKPTSHPESKTQDNEVYLVTEGNATSVPNAGLILSDAASPSDQGNIQDADGIADDREKVKDEVPVVKPYDITERAKLNSSETSVFTSAESKAPLPSATDRNTKPSIKSTMPMKSKASPTAATETVVHSPNANAAIYRGRLVDQDGEPLAGASVITQEKTVTTKPDGTFDLVLSNKKHFIVFALTDYESVGMDVSQSNLRITQVLQKSDKINHAAEARFMSSFNENMERKIIKYINDYKLGLGGTINIYIKASRKISLGEIVVLNLFDYKFEQFLKQEIIMEMKNLPEDFSDEVITLDIQP